MARIYSGADEPGVYGYEVAPAQFKRVSWGAIFAGTVVALVTGLLLTLLGMGIGLGTINPATEQDPMGGIGIGSAIWLGITALIAVFLGAWVTARLAGSVRGLNGILHGVVMWGLVTLVSFFLMTTAVGALMSGVAGIVGRTVSAVTGAAAAVAPQAAGQIQEELAQRGITMDTIMNEARQILSQTGKKELQPGQLQKELQQATEGAGAGGGAATPEAVQQELRQTLQNLFATGQTTLNAADRDAAVNVLTARTDMSRAEAEKTVDGWIQQYQQVAQSAQQAQQQALQAAEQAMNTLSRIGIWMFILLVLEAGAAALGGWLGARREPAAAAS